MQVRFKNDYLKTGERVNSHLTIREDLYTELAVLSARWKEPMGKVVDMLLKELIHNKEYQEKIHTNVKEYR